MKDCRTYFQKIKKNLEDYVSISQIQERPSPRSLGIPREFDERLAQYSGEFDAKWGQPHQAFDFNENVRQQSHAKGLCNPFFYGNIHVFFFLCSFADVISTVLEPL